MTALIISGLWGLFSVHNYESAYAAEITEENLSSIETMEVDGTIYNVRYSYLNVLENYHLEYLNHCEKLKASPESVISFDEFCETFYEQGVLTISEYVEYCKDFTSESLENDFKKNIQSNATIETVLEIGTFGSSSAGGWWIDDYEYPKPLPQQPKYGSSSFDLRPGDIIYEEIGFPAQNPILQGHIAIVEGKFVDPVYGEYWRVIESVANGVKRCILDDERMLVKKSHVLYIPAASEAQRLGALNFCIEQLGKDYWIQFYDMPTESAGWMCSTLVWAAYAKQGISVKYYSMHPYGGVFPIDFFESAWTAETYNYLDVQTPYTLSIFFNNQSYNDQIILEVCIGSNDNATGIILLYMQI